MSKIDNGGPAFPLQSIGPDFAPGYAGMTLRDYFAAKAMAAIISKTPCELIEADSPTYVEFAVAIGAYCYADAMLKAREGGEA